MKALYPDAAILVHPESPESVVALADAVGSTSQLIKAAQTLPNKTFIVATDRGIFYKMQQLCRKRISSRPHRRQRRRRRSCAHCPWMAMNTLERTLACLREGSGEIFVDPALIPRAVRPLKRMLDFTQAARLRQAGTPEPGEGRPLRRASKRGAVVRPTPVSTSIAGRFSSDTPFSGTFP